MITGPLAARPVNRNGNVPLPVGASDGWMLDPQWPRHRALNGAIEPPDWVASFRVNELNRPDDRRIGQDRLPGQQIAARQNDHGADSGRADTRRCVPSLLTRMPPGEVSN